MKIVIECGIFCDIGSKDSNYLERFYEFLILEIICITALDSTYTDLLTKI